MSTPGSISWIGTDGSRRLVARGQGLGSDGVNLARIDCGADLSCAVAIGTVDEPDRTRVTLRPGDLPVDLLGGTSCAFSPDGRRLAVRLQRELPTGATRSPTVAIIDGALGTEVGRLKGSALTGGYTPMGWSPDGRWLAVSTGTRLEVWSAEHRRAFEIDAGLSPTYALAVL